MSQQDAVALAGATLARAQRIVVFSGAGLSAESGIATFRDVGGIWDRFPQEQFAEVSGLVGVFMTHPDRLREFVCEGVGEPARAEPNAAHLALAELGRSRHVTVVTQNVDGLHQEAGSTTVHELHGTLLALQCQRCGRRTDLCREALRRLAERLSEPLPKVGKRTRLIRLLLPLMRRCETCRGRMRPAIVFFGEQLPPDAWEAAQNASIRCDVMLVVGTSATVYPAAMLPALAHETDATVIVVTLDPSFTASWVDQIVVGPAAEVVPRIVSAAAAESA